MEAPAKLVRCVAFRSQDCTPIDGWLTPLAGPGRIDGQMGRAITAQLRRSTLLFAGVWTFVALPALCTSGILVHACDCESSTGCGHETECADDPCASVALAREETAGDQLVGLLVNAPLEPAIVEVFGAALIVASDVAIDSFSTLLAVPFFFSDIPFLI